MIWFHIQMISGRTLRTENHFINVRKDCFGNNSTMEEKDIIKLQQYIGKRPQGQTDEQVLERLEKEDAKHHFTSDEWAKFLFPLCANAQSELFVKILERTNLNCEDATTLIEHTVRFRQHPGYPEKEHEQVAILQKLLQHITDDYRQVVLNNALINSAWFGEYELAKYLIAQGADLNVKSMDRSIEDLAQRAAEQFGDSRVLDMVKEHI